MSTYDELLSRVQNQNKQRQSSWRNNRKQKQQQQQPQYQQQQNEPSEAAYQDYLATRSGNGGRKKKEKPLPDWYVVSLPNDILYSLACYLWGGEQASLSCVSRDFYKVCGETVVSEFVEYFGSRHPRRMVRTVLFRMVQKSKNATNTNQKGLLLWSSHHGYIKQVRSILHSSNFNKKFLSVRRPSDGATPLFLACEQNNMEVVRLLIGKGAPVNLGTNDNLTPLHAACKEGHSGVARFLLDAKADFNRTARSGYTAMMLAAENGHAKIIEVLSKYGCDVNATTQIKDDDGGETALHRACERGHVDMVKMLIERNCDVNQATKDGRTPLIVASEEGHEVLVEYLIQGGADCRAVTKAGKTALYNACERGHVNIASMLLEGGSDPSQQTCRKKIALYTAAEQGNVELVKVLLPFTKKADLFVETTYGTTPLFIATKSGSAEVKDLLVAFCSRGSKPKRKKVTASLARAPSTPRFMTDVDPVGEKKRDNRKFKRGGSGNGSNNIGNRRISSEDIDIGDKDERLRLKDAEANAKREKELKKKEQRRLNAIRRKEELEMAENARKEERRKQFDEKYDSLPEGFNDRNGGVGWSSLVSEEQHNEMVERARKRREAKKNMKAEEYAKFEEKLRLEEEKRNKEKEKIKKEKLKRKEEMLARKKALAESQLSQQDKENNELEAKQKLEKQRKRDLKVNSFLKRQEEAAKKAKEKLDKVTAEEKAREKKKWSGVLKEDSDSHLYEDDMLYGSGGEKAPPSPPQTDSMNKIPQGNASSAVQFLRSNSNEEGVDNKKPNVVSVGLDL